MAKSRSRLTERPNNESGPLSKAKEISPKPLGKKHFSPLIKALGASLLDVSGIRRMLADGEDVNAVNASGNTALCLACGRSHHEGGPEVIRLLLEAGADPNRRGEMYAPLHLALMFGRPEIVKALLEAGADVNGRDFKGGTPLMLAADDEKIDVLQRLLDAGADPDAEDNDGHNALWHACETGEYKAAELLRPLTAEPGIAKKHG